MPISKTNAGAAKPAKGRNPTRQAFAALKNLKDGWDSYSAPAPSEAAIANAKAFVDEANRRAVIPERIEPSAMGGVGVTFSFGEREAVIEFYNNGTAHALFADDSQMHTQRVATTQAAYRKLLADIHKHVDGE